MEILFFSNFYAVFLKLLKEKEIKAKCVWYSFKKTNELIHSVQTTYKKKINNLKLLFINLCFKHKIYLSHK